MKMHQSLNLSNRTPSMYDIDDFLNYQIWGHGIQTFHIRNIFYGSGYHWLKRSIDLVISIIFCVSTLPILLLLAIIIKIDSPGPVFFVQDRTGKGGRRFKMFKLRTMVENAEALKYKYAHLNKLSFPDFKVSLDPRVTRVGSFLRKTSLDELPQIFNVIKGDMSFVGPRPTSFSASTYQLWHTARLEITPGITGLWQVSGRSNIDFDERSRLDIAYIKNISLWFDLKILYRTLFCVLNRSGAE